MPPGGMNLSRIDTDTKEFRKRMFDFINLFIVVPDDFEKVSILFVDRSGTSQARAIAAMCFEVMKSKEYFVYETIHLSGPGVDEIDTHRKNCAYCRSQAASDVHIYNKAIQIAAEIDAAELDGSTVGSKSWQTHNGTHWKKKVVLATEKDLKRMQYRVLEPCEVEDASPVWVRSS